jgi:hypothetical protein
MSLELRRALAGALLVTATACDLTYPWTSTSTSTQTESLFAEAHPNRSEATLPADFPGWTTLPIVVRSNAPEFFVQVYADALVDQVFAGPVRGSTVVQVPLRRPSEVGVGVHSGVMLVHVLVPGASYWEELPGSPFSIPFTYTVTPSALAAVVPSALALEMYEGGALPSAVVEVTGASGGDPWTVTVEGAAEWLTVAPTAGDELPVTLTVAAQPGAASGASAVIVVRRAERELRIPVSLLVRTAPPTWTGGPVVLRIVAGQPLPAPTELQLGTLTGASCPITSVWIPHDVWSLQASAPTATAPGPLVLTVVQTDLAPGRYESFVEVTCGWDWGSRAIVPVTLDVTLGDLAYSLEPIDFAITVETTPSEVFRDLALTAASAGIPFEATVEGDLVVSPSAGVVEGTQTLRVAVDVDALSAGSWFRDGAVVVRHWEPDGTRIERRIPVRIRLWYSDVQRVVPQTVATSPLGPVAVVTASRCTAGAVAMFGSLPALESSCGDDGVLRATPPALSEGSHLVWMWNGLGVVRGAKPLTVLPSRARTATAFPAPGSLSRLIVDEARGVLWGVSPASGTIQRWTEAQEWAAAVVDIPGIHDAILQHDGVSLQALAGASLVVVDATSLAVSWPSTWSKLAPSAAGGWSWRIAPTLGAASVAVTGEMLGCAAGGCWSYWLWTDTPNLAASGNDIHGATVASSGDASRVVIARHGFESDRDLLAVPPWDGWIRSTGVAASATQLALDRTGARILLLDEDAAAGATATRLLDGSYAEIPGTLPGTTEAALLSQDGRTAFTFDADARTVRIFDLEAPLSAGAFAESGVGILPVRDPGGQVTMALAADEQTLFVGGDAYVVVVPLP